MGYKLFRRCFKEYNGMAPLKYQIAEETGFQSLSYLSKFFHDRTGQSPSQFRRGRVPAPSS